MRGACAVGELDRNAIIVAQAKGSTYYLTRAPHEWVGEREHAGLFEVDEARKAVDEHGGTIVIVGQKREVRGEILGVADGGRKC